MKKKIMRATGVIMASMMVFTGGMGNFNAFAEGDTNNGSYANVLTATCASEDVLGLGNIENWMCGTYDSSGTYVADANKICLKEAFTNERYHKYKVHISSDKYAILVRCLDDEGRTLSNYKLEDGEEFKADYDETKFVIALYNTEDGMTTLDEFAEDLKNGLEIYAEDETPELSEGTWKLGDLSYELEKNCDPSVLDISEYKINESEFYASLNTTTGWKDNFGAWEDAFFPIERYLCYGSYMTGEVSGYTSSDIVKTINIYKLDSTAKTRLETMKNNISYIMNEIDDDMSDLERVLIVNEWIAPNVKYTDNLENNSEHVAGPVLGEYKGVCSGYEDAAAILLSRMGIYEASVSGNTAHEWSGVKIDGKWYQADFCWDSSRRTSNGANQHYYLLRSRAKMVNHTTKQAGYTDQAGKNIYLNENPGVDGYTNTEFDDWWVHGVYGSMYYYEGMWYYWNYSDNSIYKSDIYGNDKELVVDGHEYTKSSTAPMITGLDDGVLKYTLNGEAQELNLAPEKKSGWVENENGMTYYDAETGELVLDWNNIDDSWYYFGTDGIMVTGWNKISGKWYYFDNSGAMQKGWQQLDNNWYYFGGSGAMTTGWKQLNNKWYYFSGSGIMKTGWVKISNKWYYFNGSGAMTTGWKKLSGSWYFFNGSGVMQTGWKQINSTWYYFGTDGKMVSNTTVAISGKSYTFDENGAMTE